MSSDGDGLVCAAELRVVSFTAAGELVADLGHVGVGDLGPCAAVAAPLW